MITTKRLLFCLFVLFYFELSVVVISFFSCFANIFYKNILLEFRWCVVVVITNKFSSAKRQLHEEEEKKINKEQMNAKLRDNQLEMVKINVVKMFMKESGKEN